MTNLQNNDVGSARVGLGLFISMQLVKSFGGHLDFISQPNKGSTFIFTFNLEIAPNEVVPSVKSSYTDQIKQILNQEQYRSSRVTRSLKGLNDI